MMEIAISRLHDAILLCTGIAIVYLVVVVIQLLQLRSRPVATAMREPTVGSWTRNEISFPGEHLSFTAWLRRSNIDVELQRLRLEMNQMHKDMSAARNEIRQLHNVQQSFEALFPHNESMSLAGRRFDAAGVASQLGISLGAREPAAQLKRTPADSSVVADNLLETAASEHDERHDGRYRAAA